MSVPKDHSLKLAGNEIEAANRAEVTVLLIRAGYRLYRPEADTEGEDLVVRTARGKLLAVQLKSRMTVNQEKYGSKSLWMLFPEGPFKNDVRRKWFLVPHDKLYEVLKRKHGKAPAFVSGWSAANVPKDVGKALAKFKIP